jgi:hypothetical protein
MILLLTHQVVIVTPPKTASDSLHRLFCSGPPWNGLALVGEHSEPGNIDKHYPRLPNEAANCTTLLLVRHPLDRLVSLYLHRGRLLSYRGEPTPSFEEHCRLLVDGKLVSWLFTSTIADLVGDWKPDRLVRVESLGRDLAEAGLVVPNVPRVNFAFRRPWPAYYTPSLVQLVRPWAAKDADRFGYSLDLPAAS